MKKGMLTLILIEVFVIVILALLGFKITYAPSMDNNWDAISGCAAWAAVVASFIATFCAIRVPKKIAEEQNKISLFEKRFDSFTALQRYEAFANQLKETTEINKYKKAFLTCFYESTAVSISIEDVMFRINTLSTPLHQMIFLYDDIPVKEISDMFSCLLDLVAALQEDKNVDELKSKYINIVDEFMKKHGKKICEQLMLSK